MTYNIKINKKIFYYMINILIQTQTKQINKQINNKKIYNPIIF